VLQKDSNKLTKGQIKILIEFLLLDDQVYKFTRYSKHGKIAVRKALKEKYNKTITTNTLDVLLKILEVKGIIYKDLDKVKYTNKGLKTTLDSALKSNDPVEFIFKLKIAK
jgi:hypothetical protein